MAINPLLYPTLPYDPSSAFTPIGIVAIAPVVIAINAAVPANSLREFVAYAKAHPGKLNNSAGSTISNVAAELFKQMADIRLTSIPYKGSAPSVAAVLAGDTQLVVVDAAAIAAQIRAGKIKGLAVAGPTRLSVLPDVPTVAEAGMPAYKLDAWVALFAPAGTPPAAGHPAQLRSRRHHADAGRARNARRGARSGRRHARRARHRAQQRPGALRAARQVAEHEGRLKRGLAWTPP